MTNFKAVKLGDIASVISGYAFKSREFGDAGIPVIKIANIRVGSVDLSDCAKVSYEYLQRINHKFRVNPGDILISLTGSHVTQPNSVVGRVAQMPLSAPQCLLNQRAGKVINNDDGICDSGYLYRYLSLASQHGDIAVMASGAASQANVSPTQVESLTIRLPNLSIQQRITATLSAYDDLIENNTHRIKILEEMAQAIYREWFVKFHFPGHEKVKMTDSLLGPIPVGWGVVKLGEVANVNELSIKRNNEPEQIEYIDIKSVGTGFVESTTSYSFQEAPGRARRIVRDGDTIWATVRPNRRSYSLILDPVENLIASTGFAVLTPKNVPFTYLYHSVTTNDFAEYLVNHATGAAYPAVNAKDFSNATVLVPDKKVLGLFNDAVEPMYRQKHVLAKKNHILRDTRDLLLPRLISGELSLDTVNGPEVAHG